MALDISRIQSALAAEKIDGWLLYDFRGTNAIAESLGIGKARGALIAGVTDGSPAAKAGVKTGDVVVKFDGHEIKDMRELPKVVADTPIGKAVDMMVLRDGKEVTVTATLGERPNDQQLAADRGGALVGELVEEGLRLLGDHEQVAVRDRADVEEREDIVGGAVLRNIVPRTGVNLCWLFYHIQSDWSRRSDQSFVPRDVNREVNHLPC